MQISPFVGVKLSLAVLSATHRNLKHCLVRPLTFYMIQIYFYTDSHGMSISLMKEFVFIIQIIILHNLYRLYVIYMSTMCMLYNTM